MRRKISLWASVLLISALLLSACGKEQFDCMVIVLDPTTFTEKEITQGLHLVESAAAEEFAGSRLKEMAYDESLQYSSGQTMVIRTTISQDGSSATSQWVSYDCRLKRGGKDWIVELWTPVS